MKSLRGYNKNNGIKLRPARLPVGLAVVPRYFCCVSPDEFRQLDLVLPETPGVYRYYDPSERLLYVGKAKNLRKRVSSYFRPDLHREGRLRMMIDRIARIDYTLTETEMDALLLENSLIKTYQPRYNIRLKDDKSYPYLVIRNEHFPRIFPTRRLIRDGSTYLGPFSSVMAMRTMLELVRRIYPLRTCSLPLSPTSIARGKFRACLEYQIGNCLAPCEGRQSEESYLEQIDAIRQILKGHYQKAAGLLREEMKQHAADLRFEQAARVKKKMDLLDQYQAKSTVVHHDITDTDVFSVVMKDDTAVVNFLHMQQGRIVISHNLEISRRLDEDESTLLLYGIVELRNRYGTDSKLVLLNREVEGLPSSLDVQVPRQGEKKKIVEMSWKNAMYFLNDLIRQREDRQQETKTARILAQMQKDLALGRPPAHIECFDNSNFHGTSAVSACVVFRDGKPCKRDYRHFLIRSVEGPDDFASMREAVYRRYRRLLDEQSPLPDLVVVDGGKGQLSSALEALALLGLDRKLPVLGIAKNLEELFYPHDPVPLHLDKKGITLKIVQQMRDEAHRFGLAHHRNLRSRRFIATQLTEIPGVGPKSAEVLLRRFGSVERLCAASPAEWTAAVGARRAEAIRLWCASQSKVAGSPSSPEPGPDSSEISLNGDSVAAMSAPVSSPPEPGSNSMEISLNVDSVAAMSAPVSSPAQPGPDSSEISLNGDSVAAMSATVASPPEHGHDSTEILLNVDSVAGMSSPVTFPPEPGTDPSKNSISVDLDEKSPGSVKR